MTTKAHILEGKLVAGDGPDFSRHCMVSNEQFASDRLMTASAADRAINAAVKSRFAMQALDVEARAAILNAIADGLELQKDKLAAQISLETGCPTDQSCALNVMSAVELLRAYAELVQRHQFIEQRAGLRGGQVVINKHPVGVVVGIVPWNVPLFLACMKIAPAMAAGCPVIIKPSPENFHSMAQVADILTSTDIANLGMPGAGLQWLIGGRDLGEALVAHPEVDKVSFTGSTLAGRKVGQQCGANLTRCTLELGGKSAAILLDDFDLEPIRDQFFLALLQNNGQVCGAQSRVLVPRKQLERIKANIADFFSTLETGDPLQAGVEIGPVATQKQHNTVGKFIHRAKASDVQLLAGGTLSKTLSKQWLPTLFYSENPDAEIAREEVFGPVVTLIPYDTIEQAVAISNDSPYGLSGSIWTPNIERAVNLAQSLRTGSVAINSKKILDFGAPFGGFRNSGVGRELGPEGIESYVETSSVLVPDQ